MHATLLAAGLAGASMHASEVLGLHAHAPRLSRASHPGRMKQACKRRACAHPVLPDPSLAAAASEAGAARARERGLAAGWKAEEGAEEDESFDEAELGVDLDVGDLGSSELELEARRAEIEARRRPHLQPPRHPSPAPRPVARHPVTHPPPRHPQHWRHTCP